MLNLRPIASSTDIKACTAFMGPPGMWIRRCVPANTVLPVKWWQFWEAYMRVLDQYLIVRQEEGIEISDTVEINYRLTSCFGPNFGKNTTQCFFH